MTLQERLRKLADGSMSGFPKDTCLEAAAELDRLGAQVLDLELALAIERGTKAWAGVPDKWLEDLRGHADELVEVKLPDRGFLGQP